MYLQHGTSRVKSRCLETWWRSVDALRHVTYRNLAPWKPLDELLLMPLAKRILYIRKNLAGAGRRVSYMNQDEFAAAVGAKDRHRVIGWETKAETPRDYTKQISDLTPYPPAALGGEGEAELFEETLDLTLRSLRGEIVWMRSQLARAFVALGIPLELPEEEPPAQSDGALQ
jgi:hypothetical protein